MAVFLMCVDPMEQGHGLDATTKERLCRSGRGGGY